MSDWISVQDRLPPHNEEVWVYDKEHGVIIGQYTVIRGRGSWSHIYGDNDGLGDDRLCYVTHWLPMERPRPPC